jgi:SM-20-related protein
MPVLELEAFEAAPLASAPFPHVILRDFVRGAAFDEAIADYPEIKQGGSFPVFTQKPGPGLQRLLDALNSDDFRQAVERKFGVDLSGRPTMTTLRGRARTKDGQIHTDSKTKLVTVLLYLNRATGDWENHAGCLRILNGPDSLDDYAAEAPPVDGTVVVFPCVPNAWHGHEPFEGKRRVIQLNWVTDQGVVEREQKRHAVSAFFKKVNPFQNPDAPDRM